MVEKKQEMEEIYKELNEPNKEVMNLLAHSIKVAQDYAKEKNSY